MAEGATSAPQHHLLPTFVLTHDLFLSGAERLPQAPIVTAATPIVTAVAPVVSAASTRSPADVDDETEIDQLVRPNSSEDDNDDDDDDNNDDDDDDDRATATLSTTRLRTARIMPGWPRLDGTWQPNPEYDWRVNVGRRSHDDGAADKNGGFRNVFRYHQPLAVTGRYRWTARVSRRGKSTVGVFDDPASAARAADYRLVQLGETRAGELNFPDDFERLSAAARAAAARPGARMGDAWLDPPGGWGRAEGPGYLPRRFPGDDDGDTALGIVSAPAPLPTVAGCLLQARPTSSKSGFRGVYVDEGRHGFTVQVHCNGKAHNVGTGRGPLGAGGPQRVFVSAAEGVRAFVGWLVGCVGWLVGRSVVWLVGWLVCLLVGWLVGRSAFNGYFYSSRGEVLIIQ